MSKVVVGMSGGVDSAVAAYLLKAAGYDVVGLTLRTWDQDSGELSRCCEIDDAREAANIIGIPYYTLNCVSNFRQKVVVPFMDEYLRGMTPNPCIGCNRDIKWERMMYFTKVVGADYVATGHYASVVRGANGRYAVKRAQHAEKDQTYMLYLLTQEQLASTMMPLGALSKAEVRTIAENIGLPVAHKADSQEICFVSDDDYAGYIERNYDGELPPEGWFVGENGEKYGRHNGIYHYTVGQRKGLGIALGKPAYVKKIDPDRNEVMLADNESLFTRNVICERANFQSVDEPEEGQEIRCSAKVRYRHSAQPATVTKESGGRIRVYFDEPVRAAAPGQSAVFYDEDGCLIGGGVIVDSY